MSHAAEIRTIRVAGRAIVREGGADFGLFFLARVKGSGNLRSFLQGSEVVQLILDHGKLRPPEIISQLSVHDPIKGASHCNVLTLCTHL